MKPEDIEKRSFEIIESELEFDLDPVLAPIIKRVIHTTADFEYANSLVFSENAVSIAREAISRGASIVTDTNMARAGINASRLGRFGGKVICYMADDDVAEAARASGVTRAVKSMEKAALLNGPVILAIGNAPTALIRICELIQSGEMSPALVIGAPVGFVNVIESKEALMRESVPHIVSTGRKGGSTVTAAICNALIYGIE